MCERVCVCAHVCVSSRRSVDRHHDADGGVERFQVHVVLHLGPTTRPGHRHYGDADEGAADVGVQSDDITQVRLHQRALKEEPRETEKWGEASVSPRWSFYTHTGIPERFRTTFNDWDNREREKDETEWNSEE